MKACLFVSMGFLSNTFQKTCAINCKSLSKSIIFGSDKWIMAVPGVISSPSFFSHSTIVPSFIVGESDGILSTTPTSDAEATGGAGAAGAAAGAGAAGAGAAGEAAGIWMELMSSPSSARMAISSPIWTFLASLYDA